jgi:hypothetical protein
MSERPPSSSARLRILSIAFRAHPARPPEPDPKPPTRPQLQAPPRRAAMRTAPEALCWWRIHQAGSAWGWGTSPTARLHAPPPLRVALPYRPLGSSDPSASSTPQPVSILSRFNCSTSSVMRDTFYIDTSIAPSGKGGFCSVQCLTLNCQLPHWSPNRTADSLKSENKALPLFIICMYIPVKGATAYWFYVLPWTISYARMIHHWKHHLYHRLPIFPIKRGVGTWHGSHILIPDNSCIYAQDTALCKGVGRITTTTLTYEHKTVLSLIKALPFLFREPQHFSKGHHQIAHCSLLVCRSASKVWEGGWGCTALHRLASRRGCTGGTAALSGVWVVFR